MLQTLPKSNLLSRSETPAKAGTNGLGLWIPLIGAFFLVLDIILRPLPIGPFSFRPYEPLARFALPSAPFDRCKSITIDKSYGDLAYSSNLPQYRVYHRQTASTDRLGFRNDDRICAAPQIAGVCIGDSFTTGYGLNDDETLPVQLSRLYAKPVYNAGAYSGFAGLRAPLPLNLFSQLNFKHGFVIAEVAENNIPQIDFVKGESAKFFTVLSPQERVKRLVSGWTLVSPFRQILSCLIRPLQNDILLPNVSSQNVVVGELQNGQPMLFAKSSFAAQRKEPFLSSRSLQQWIEVDRNYKKLGYTYIVLIVPDRVSIYGPLLKNSRNLAKPPQHILEVEKTLRANGITVVDVYDTLSREAAHRLSRNEYLFWTDDTHWTPTAVRLVAGRIMETLNQTMNDVLPSNN